MKRLSVRSGGLGQFVMDGMRRIIVSKGKMPPRHYFSAYTDAELKFRRVAGAVFFHEVERFD